MPDAAEVIAFLEQLILAVNPFSLFVLSFIEAIFFPIPPDAVLMPLALLRPEMAPLFAVVATLGSVAGAAVGYGLGLRGGRPVLERVASRGWIQRVEELFGRFDVWAVGMAGFTPIPYKVVAVAAGVFGLHFRRFLVVSLVSRGARFLVVSLLIMLYGEAMVGFLRDHFGIVTLVIFTAAALVYLAARSWRGRMA